MTTKITPITITQNNAPQAFARSTDETPPQSGHVGPSQAEARPSGPNITAPEIPGAQSGSWSRSGPCGSVRVMEIVTGGVG